MPETETKYISARQSGLMQCLSCYMLMAIPEEMAADQQCRCPRCGDLVHVRIPNSLSRSWALVIASLILFVPANMLPLMTVSSLGVGQPDTIMSGVIHLMHSDMMVLGLIVFIASILVPLLKIVGIILLLLSVHFRWNSGHRQRTALYRLIEFVGRWSMLDIFVITLLVALVNFGKIASISAGPAAAAFAAVVVLTMLAAINFDARMLWDVKHD